MKFIEYAAGMNIDEVMAAKDVTRNANAFTDTDDPDILAAYALGVTNGTGNDGFTPDGEITREQAATMLMNACGVLGMVPDDIPIAEFADISSVSDWAQHGVNFCALYNIMQGTGNDNFSPKATYTREQSIITFNNIKHNELPGQ